VRQKLHSIFSRKILTILKGIQCVVEFVDLETARFHDNIEKTSFTLKFANPSLEEKQFK